MPAGDLDSDHYKAVHRHLFQDVYAWAGKIRTVRISKGGNLSCLPEFIDKEMNKLFGELAEKDYFQGLNQEAFASEVAHFLAELNAIHAFREGNGRTQLTFLTFLADEAGQPLQLERLDPTEILAATIESFDGDEVALESQIASLL